MYLIEILHQTTTPFYILFLICRCILSKFYIKPQLRCLFLFLSTVVSYRNSTSNHNIVGRGKFHLQLYLIEILHQTTTIRHIAFEEMGLYLIEILHQTTTKTDEMSVESTLYLIEILHQTTTSGLILIDKVLLTGCLPL